MRLTRRTRRRLRRLGEWTAIACKLVAALLELRKQL